MHTNFYLNTLTVTINCSYKFFAPGYIDMTANINHSSTPSLHIAHFVISHGTPSKAFSKSTKPGYSFFPLTLRFSCICLTIKMASVVPLPVPEAYTFLGFSELEVMGCQWHQLDHMQIIYTLLQTDNCDSTSSLTLSEQCQSTEGNISRLLLSLNVT